MNTTTDTIPTNTGWTTTDHTRVVVPDDLPDFLTDAARDAGNVAVHVAESVSDLHGTVEILHRGFTVVLSTHATRVLVHHADTGWWHVHFTYDDRTDTTLATVSF